MDPSTTQYAAMVPDAATQRGGFKATPDTGSPMSEVGIVLPTLAVVQAVSGSVLLSSIVRSCRQAALIQVVLTKRRTMTTHPRVMFGIAEASNINRISRHRIRRDDPMSNRSHTVAGITEANTFD
jgi:hypothetical protein